MKRAAVLGALLAPALGATAAVLAQVAAFDLSWSRVAGGGATTTTGGGYTLGGTIGQAEAGTLSGGAYTLSGGFWGGISGSETRIFVPLSIKQAAP